MTKFIKTYWLQILLILSASSYLAIELANQEWTDVIFALAFVLTAVHSLLLKTSYDELWEDHESLIMDYVNELRSNIDFIGKTKITLSSLAEEISEVKQEVKPKRGRPKKVVPPVKAKRGRPRSTK